VEQVAAPRKFNQAISQTLRLAVALHHQQRVEWLRDRSHE
jgi:hypothetical protein